VNSREIVKAALAANAAGLVFAHNHPSDNAWPSADDFKLTRSLRSAIELIDVTLRDHLAVSAREVVSIAEIEAIEANSAREVKQKALQRSRKPSGSNARPKVTKRG
jgi:hypothetical protein